MNRSNFPTTALSPEAAKMIGHFEDIDLTEASPVEPASLAPFCTPGDFLNISGPAGFGKTTLGVDLVVGAFHPAREGKALGGVVRFYPDEPRLVKSAIIDSESTNQRWASSISRRLTCEGLDQSVKNHIRYIPASKLGLSCPRERAATSRFLAESLAHDQREFVLIDSLAMTWKPTNPTDTEWVFEGLSPFREACKEYGITVVALTHTPRPNQQGTKAVGPIGTSFQENQADAQLIITRLPQGLPRGIRLTHRKSRRSFWIQQDTFVDLGFDGKQGYAPVGSGATKWPMEWSEQQTPSPHLLSPIHRVECLVRDAGTHGIPAAQIARELDISGRTIRNHLQRLATDGVVDKFGSGRNFRWRIRP